MVAAGQKLPGRLQPLVSHLLFYSRPDTPPPEKGGSLPPIQMQMGRPGRKTPNFAESTNFPTSPCAVATTPLSPLAPLHSRFPGCFCSSTSPLLVRERPRWEGTAGMPIPNFLLLFSAGPGHRESHPASFLTSKVSSPQKAEASGEMASTEEKRQPVLSHRVRSGSLVCLSSSPPHCLQRRLLCSCCCRASRRDTLRSPDSSAKAGAAATNRVRN